MPTSAPYPDLSPGTHLLLDEYVVADMYKLRRTVHTPRKEPCEPVMTPDQPWEDRRTDPCHVTFDETTGRWRMWYMVFHRGVSEERKKLNTSVNGNVGAPQPHYICCAESDDGIAWRKPALGIVDDAHGKTNIVFKGFSGAWGGILDLPCRPNHDRFVLANCEWFAAEHGKGGITLAHSPDGLHWQYLHPDAVIPGDSDTVNNIVFDPQTQRYLIYMRAWHAATLVRNRDYVAGPGYAYKHSRNTRRRVGCAVSSDLIHWSEPQIVFYPDENQTNDFYGMDVFRAGGYFLGQVKVFDDDAWETMHVELVHSRDGIRWRRFPTPSTFIPVTEPGQPDGYLTYTIQTPVNHGDQTIHYWSGLDYPHDLARARSTIYRGTLRRDGYVSLDASRQMGALILRPFTLQSDRILINADTRGGKIAFALTEPWCYEPEGKPIEGCGFDDCDPFEGDSTRHALSWKGRSDLSHLKGKRLMLRMRWYHGRVFSATI